MRNVTHAVLLVATFAAFSLNSAVVRAQSSEHKSNGTNDLEGKIIVIFLDREFHTPSQVLSDVKFKEIGGRTFIVGTGADTHRKDDWTKGLPIRIAWQSVTGFIELTSAEYDKYLRDAEVEGTGLTRAATSRFAPGSRP